MKSTGFGHTWERRLKHLEYIEINRKNNEKNDRIPAYVFYLVYYHQSHILREVLFREVLKLSTDPPSLKYIFSVPESKVDMYTYL